MNFKSIHKRSRGNQKQIIQMLILAVGTVFAQFLWQGHKGFNLWDEGFLWYGVQRVMAGEVPIRDFIAYDPGRYYWSAAVMNLWGDNGIMALRTAVAVFQAFGLFIGLMLIARNSSKQNALFWLLTVITLVIWMFPRHKLFDISLSIALIGTLSFLVENPSSLRYFLSGLIVGFIAVFGRNHGLYGLVGSMGAMAYLFSARNETNGPGTVKAVGIWTFGVMTGFFPILLMIAVIPGFALAFWESIPLLKTATISFPVPLPIPWPWRVPFGQLTAVDMVRGVLVGFFFIVIVVYGVLGIAWVIRQRQQNKPVSSALVASAFLALPYSHYAYSRADVGHLSLGIFPFLIGSFVMLANQPEKIRWSFAALLCGASLLVMLPMHPGWQCCASQQCVTADVAGSKLTIDQGTADDLVMLKKLAARFAPGNRSFIAHPLWPGAYAALERKSPLWEVYSFLHPRSNVFQQAEIERIKAANPGFVMLYDLPVDERDELRFSKTHPIIVQYIRDHFERIDGFTQNPAYQIYKCKQTIP
jgi:hypothetical protein